MSKSDHTNPTTRDSSRKPLGIATTVLTFFAGLSIVAGLAVIGSKSDASVAQPSASLVEAYRATLDAAE